MRGDGRTHCAEASAPAGPALSLGSRRHGGTWQGCGDVQGARAAPGHLPHAPSLKVFWGSLGGAVPPLHWAMIPVTQLYNASFVPLTETTFDQFSNRYFTSSRCLPALFALIVGGSNYFLGVWYYTPVVLASTTDSRNTHRPSVFSSVPSVCTGCCAFLLCTTFLLHSLKTAPYLSSSLCLYLLNFSTWGNADFISFLGRRKRWRRGYKKKRVKKKIWKSLFPIEMKHISLPNGIYPFR